MIKYIALLVALVLLSGCERPEWYSEQRYAMTVVNVYLTSKSNSKVTLRNDSTGHIYQPARLSCNRSSAEKVVIGSKWDVTEVTYFYPESKRYVIELAGTPAICTKSNQK
jgi:hypothetical protein